MGDEKENCPYCGQEIIAHKNTIQIPKDIFSFGVGLLLGSALTDKKIKRPKGMGKKKKRKNAAIAKGQGKK